MSTFTIALLCIVFGIAPILGLIAYVGVMDWRKRQVTKALKEKFGNVVHIKQDWDAV